MATFATSPAGGFRTFNLNDFGDAGGNLSAGNPVATSTSNSSPIAGLPAAIAPTGTPILGRNGIDTDEPGPPSLDVESTTREELEKELATLGNIQTGLRVAGLFAPTPVGFVLGLSGIAVRARTRTITTELTKRDVQKQQRTPGNLRRVPTTAIAPKDVGGRSRRGSERAGRTTGPGRIA